MDGEAQIISMPGYLKKTLFLILVISVLSFFIFLGINYIKGNYLASLAGIITAWVTINPLEVDVSAPAEVEIGKNFEVKAKVINKGEEKIETVKGEIFLSEGLVLLRKDSIQEIGVIPGKKEKKIAWPVKGEKIGSYIISVKVSGEFKGQIISAEGNTLVEVKKSLRKTGPRDWLRNLFEFFYPFLSTPKPEIYE